MKTGPNNTPDSAGSSPVHCSVPCFVCKHGHYETELWPYEYYRLANDKEPVAIFHDIPVEVCDQCGDICFGPEGLKAIEKQKENFRQND